MTYHLTVVRDIPLDVQTKVIGRYWTPEEAEESSDNSPDFLGVERDESHFEDQVEDKVVKTRGRRPSRPTPGVETK